MFLHYGGRYRTAVECRFLEQVKEELTKFDENCECNSVLVFPPLAARYRLLIHQLAGADPRLKTVSIGQEEQRRTLVYLAVGGESNKMAHSPSTAQRTFFGRGRARRLKRPDQPLYIPGALRQAKQEQQEESFSKERSINKAGNKEISEKNSRGEQGSPPSATHGSDASDGSNCEMTDKCSKQHDCEPKTAESVYDSTTPLCTGAEDISKGTGGTSSDANEHVDDMQSLVSSDQSMLKENMETEWQNAGKGDGDQTAADTCNSCIVFVPNSSKIVGIRDKSVKGETRSSDIDDQSCKKEADCSKHSLSDQNTGNIQDCACTLLGDYRTVENVLRNSHHNSLKVEEGFSEWTRCEISSSPNHGSIMPPKPSELDTQQEGCTERVTVMKGGSLLACDDMSIAGGLVKDSVEPRKKDDENKGMNFEGELQFAERITSDNVTEAQLPSESSNPDSRMFATPGDLTTSGDDVTNQQMNSEKYPPCLSGNISKDYKENSVALDSNECHLMGSDQGPQVMSNMSPPLNTSEESGNIVKETSDHHPLCLSNNGKLESLSNQPTDLLLNSGEQIEDSDAQLRNINEDFPGLPGRTGTSSGCLVMEFNLSEESDAVSKVQTELPKTSSSKKKKSKKEKVKEGEEKTKSKEKREKKKKKEKKIGKTEKKDKESISDSEGKMKGERKPVIQELSSKKKKEKDLNACNEISTEDLLTDPTGGGESGCGESADDDDNWESNFDESGDCLKPENLEELSRLTGIANPKVHKTQFDYYSFTPTNGEVDDEEYGHIVEIYDFSPDLNTQDIMQALSSFRSKGIDIKWVDDTHALGIFSSYISAHEAIRSCSSPMMKLRPISQGTPESRRKAMNCFEFLKPYKERPQTSKLLADRLVTGALGMRSKMTKEERVKEREKLKEAKHRKRQEQIEKAKIWGD